MADLDAKFPDLGLKFSIGKNQRVCRHISTLQDLSAAFAPPPHNYTGGQISFDAFPVGWDKTFCLNLIDLSQFKAVHFFGDKTHPVSIATLYYGTRLKKL